MYDPTIGRWLSADPIGFEAGDVNFYRYAGNNVTTLTDASGTVPVCLNSLRAMSSSFEAALGFQNPTPPKDPFAPPESESGPETWGSCSANVRGPSSELSFNVGTFEFNPDIGAGCYKVQVIVSSCRVSQAIKIPLKIGGCDGIRGDFFGNAVTDLSAACNAGRSCASRETCCSTGPHHLTRFVPFVFPIPWPNPRSLQESDCLIVVPAVCTVQMSVEVGVCLCGE